MTPLVAGELPSYRDLPMNLYQIEWKYRDEFRPRFGLLRVREFLMKDAYTFDRDEEGMRALLRGHDQSLPPGLRPVRAVVRRRRGRARPDRRRVNHEFMAVADVGEDLYVSCANCDYLADIEAAYARGARTGRTTRRSSRSSRSTRRARRRSQPCPRSSGARRADAEEHAVRRRRDRRRGARARGPRGERGEARAPVLPDAGRGPSRTRTSRRAAT